MQNASSEDRTNRRATVQHPIWFVDEDTYSPQHQSLIRSVRNIRIRRTLTQ
jgi:hypothetical protein